MLHIIETYSMLGSSHIEGIEVMNSRFQLLVAGMKKKPYDLLDQRKSDFDIDLEEFKRLTVDILVSCEQRTAANVASGCSLLVVANCRIKSRLCSTKGSHKCRPLNWPWSLFSDFKGINMLSIVRETVMLSMLCCMIPESSWSSLRANFGPI